MSSIEATNEGEGPNPPRLGRFRQTLAAAVRWLTENKAVGAFLTALATLLGGALGFFGPVVTHYIEDTDTDTLRQLQEVETDTLRQLQETGHLQLEQNKQSAQEEELRTYFSDVGELLRSGTDVEGVSKVARAKTLAMLDRLEADNSGNDDRRKRLKTNVLLFLIESRLVNVRPNDSDETPVISLADADLKDTLLGQKNQNIQRYGLAYADLAKADLTGADLTEVNLSNANLSEASLIGTNLSEAYLSGSNLNGATLTRADLTGADLAEASDLTQEQIEQASGDEYTKLPEGLDRPESWTQDNDKQTEGN